jgi:hypothetical protein
MIRIHCDDVRYCSKPFLLFVLTGRVCYADDSKSDAGRKIVGRILCIVYKLSSICVFVYVAAVYVAVSGRQQDAEHSVHLARTHQSQRESQHSRTDSYDFKRIM